MVHRRLLLLLLSLASLAAGGPPSDRSRDIELGKLIPMSLLCGLEYSNYTETIRVAEEYNVTLPLMPPRFMKPGNMNRVVAKPAGNILLLKCPAEGNPQPNITWTKDGAASNRSLDVPFDRWSLILVDLVESDSGNYTCIVCNLCGCINFTSEVEITERVSLKPYVEDGYPQNVTALVNTRVTFSCPTYSEVLNYVYWVKTPHRIEDETDLWDVQMSPTYQFVIPTDINTPELLELRNVAYKDEGWYTCVVGNSLGVAYASAYLHVVDRKPIPVSQLCDQKYSNDTETIRVAREYNVTLPLMPPRFTKPGNMDRVVTKPAGYILRLMCPAEGNPEPNITWTKDGAAPYRLLEVPFDRWSLRVDNLVLSDAGNYSCIVCNLCGCINFNFKVDIFEPYRMGGSPQNVTALVNTTVAFLCPENSALDERLIWIKTPHRIKDGQRITKFLRTNPHQVRVGMVQVRTVGATCTAVC